MVPPNPPDRSRTVLHSPPTEGILKFNCLTRIPDSTLLPTGTPTLITARFNSEMAFGSCIVAPLTLGCVAEVSWTPTSTRNPSKTVNLSSSGNQCNPGKPACQENNAPSPQKNQ